MIYFFAIGSYQKNLQNLILRLVPDRINSRHLILLCWCKITNLNSAKIFSARISSAKISSLKIANSIKHVVYV